MEIMTGFVVISVIVDDNCGNAGKLAVVVELHCGVLSVVLGFVSLRICRKVVEEQVPFGCGTFNIVADYRKIDWLS